MLYLSKTDANLYTEDGKSNDSLILVETDVSEIIKNQKTKNNVNRAISHDIVTPLISAQTWLNHRIRFYICNVIGGHKSGHQSAIVSI